MSDYNPNSIWTSKKEKFVYHPPADRAAARKTSPEPAAPDPGEKSYIWWWAGGLFALLIGLGVLFFVYRPAQGPNVSIGFVKPDNVLLGDPFPIAITLSNYSQNILKNAILTITLPDSVAFVGQSAGSRSMQQSVGDIGPGSVYKFNGDNNANLIAVDDPNASGNIKHIDVTLAYHTDTAPNDTFTTKGGADIYLEGPAVSFTMAAPTAVVSGQNFDFTINYVNNTHHDFNNAKLMLQFPPAYSFVRASMPANSAASNSWNLDTIAAGGTGNVVITGNIVGPENANYPLNALLSGDVAGNTYALSSASANLAVAASPLSLTIALNGDPLYVTRPGDSLDYVLAYTNNSNIVFQNVTISAALAGRMFDPATVQTNGSFNSLTNTITWNAATVPALLNVAPGASGSVDFRVRTKSAYPIVRSYDKNFTLAVTGQIVSPTVPPGTAASSTVSVAKVENKVAGEIAVAAKGFWHDSTSGISNSGPYPPKVNKATQYTIHWVITNYSTDMGNVTLTASLQSGTTCTGQIQSNMPTAPTCDASSGSVSWTIPTIPATMGTVGPAAEAVFQVTNTPASNQIGSAVTLMGPTTLQATDLFTSSTVTVTAPAVTTLLPDDKTVSGGGAVVP